MARKPPIEITDGHRRTIVATLGLLDEALCRFDRWAVGEEALGVLYRQSNRLSRDQRQAIMKEISALRRIMRVLRSDLRLRPKVEDVSVAIWSRASSHWPGLEELRAKHLRRYGGISPNAKQYLDAKVDELVEHVHGLMQAVTNKDFGLTQHQNDGKLDEDTWV